MSVFALDSFELFSWSFPSTAGDEDKITSRQKAHQTPSDSTKASIFDNTKRGFVEEVDRTKQVGWNGCLGEMIQA